jgi:hypothetical protein
LGRTHPTHPEFSLHGAQKRLHCQVAAKTQALRRVKNRHAFLPCPGCMLTLLRSLSSDQAGDFSRWKISSTPIAVPEEGVSYLPRARKLTGVRGTSRITTDSTEITQADDEHERKDNGSCRRHRRWRHCPGRQATGLSCFRFNGRVNHRLDA